MRQHIHYSFDRDDAADLHLRKEIEENANLIGTYELPEDAMKSMACVLNNNFFTVDQLEAFGRGVQTVAKEIIARHEANGAVAYSLAVIEQKRNSLARFNAALLAIRRGCGRLV